MDDGEDAEQLRGEDDDWSDEATRGEQPGNLGEAVLVGRTTRVGTYPTAAGAYYAVRPQVVGGAEVEGGTATLANATNGVIYALNLGTTIPPEGTYVICTFIGSRWIFRYD